VQLWGGATVRRPTRRTLQREEGKNMAQTASQTELRVVRKRVRSLRPSPENTEIYRDTDFDPDIGKLAESIRKNTLLQRPIITEDRYIVSGHRRVAALKLLGQQWVDCCVLPFRRRDMTKDEYIVLLREHNQQRNKTLKEQIKEELVDINTEDAHARLLKDRHSSVFTPEIAGVPILKIEGRSRRSEISDDKAEHVRLIKEIIEGRRAYWPLSVRGVHYPLLNYEFVRGYYWPHRNEPDHGAQRVLKYKNDDGSYKATSDLITRLRLNGEIPWNAFDDFTRPYKEFRAFRDARQFAKQMLDRLFEGYWRKLLQTQPNHVQVVCEKNTVYHMAMKLTETYQIPTSSGRGFNGIDAWYDIYQNFRNSGKERLILIVLSDYDPEGEQIPHVGGRTLRDDFGIDEDKLVIIKAGVTRRQIEKYRLPAQNFAKEDSPNLQWFKDRNGGDESIYELEALEPDDMLRDLDAVICSTIDINLYNKEVAAEKEEAQFLKSLHDEAIKALNGILDGLND
jgi:hypothetical protein